MIWFREIWRSKLKFGMLAVAVVFYGLACTPLSGPVGLGDLGNGQYVGKIVFGAIAAYAVLAHLERLVAEGRVKSDGGLTLQATFAPA